MYLQLRMTPLHWAVERGCTQTVELLLKHGANTNIESKFDKTALEIASENGRPDIFEILQVWMEMFCFYFTNEFALL